MMLHLSDFREKRFKILIRIFRMNAAEEDVKFHGRCRSTNTNVISQRFSCCHGQIIMSHKRIGGKALQQLFTIRRLTLMLRRTGSIRRTCFQTCCFFGVFIFFFKRPRAEIITCRLNPCLFKLGNQERTERVTFFSPGFVGSD